MWSAGSDSTAPGACCCANGARLFASANPPVPDGAALKLEASRIAEMDSRAIENVIWSAEARTELLPVVFILFVHVEFAELTAFSPRQRASAGYKNF
jgi:hypothetical protein